MLYGKSPSTTAPVPPTGMSTVGVAGFRGCGVSGCSAPFLVDFPNGESGTVFAGGLATGFGTSTTGCGLGGAAGFGIASDGGVTAGAGTGIRANLMLIIGTT